MKTNKAISFAVFGVLCVFLFGAGPMLPTSQIKSSSATNANSAIDLPYKPTDVFSDESEDSEEVMDLESLGVSETEEKNNIDWSVVPTTPSKYPEIGLAPDPDLV